VQLYDMLVGPLTWLVLMAVERRRIRPIGAGLIAGTFLTTYFSGRFVVEFFKGPLVEQLRESGLLYSIEQTLGVSLRMGQWLSLIAIMAGLFLIRRALRSPPLATDDRTRPA
jgi:prolipoprotein diacylglyceryltransferase